MGKSQIFFIKKMMAAFSLLEEATGNIYSKTPR